MKLLDRCRLDVSRLVMRPPGIEDGPAIYRLIANSPPLDLNSPYAYFLQALHFSDTCLLAEDSGSVAAYVSAYVPRNSKDTLFVWQVATHPDWRGQGLARLLICNLLARHPELRWLETTIGPSNLASQTLFQGVARVTHAGIQVQPCFATDLFRAALPDSAAEHEAEMLYRIGPIDSPCGQAGRMQ